MNIKTTLADVIAGIAPGDKKRWRFEDEVPAPTDMEYKKLQPDSETSKVVAQYLGLSKINTPSPEGHVILGFRERGWRRPLVVKDGEGTIKLMAESAVKRYFFKKKKQA